MKKTLFGVGLSVVFLLFSGCSHKEVLVSKYYPNYAKDDILLAGKYAFLTDKHHEYIVDSYRDRLEATKIDLIFHVLFHEDYVLKVEEDACGTLATLMLDGSFGVKKMNKYSSLEHKNLQIRHNEFWEKIELFTSKENCKNIFIEPTKDMSECKIKNEFENGLVKDNVKNPFGVCDENH
ncbi:hypothetical protein [Sulfurimonas sp.]|jgi:hypothetical protein|uniref:hypothetical protein n=1 Tax=Sulfurimonas sp. TaxID=2022749 RepID=UPI002600A855|nr:hypothetical protein [Sulfurimonas sp.]MCK9472605.1 hypothetical protein [Sulfurimonas sp.]MDD3506072.1 hypothetical protein [Sulfurimonas sp.]